jgi:ligand-binding sensor domain-containing protein
MMVLMRNRIVSILIFALALINKQGTAQSYYFRGYSVDEGLPFISVSAVFQDTKGNIWSGGYGGLSKFDGNSFTNFSPKDGLLNHSVTCINQDNQGNLWIGTINGVNKYDGKKFTAYTTKHGLISNYITCCAKDAKGDLWFGTDKGISKLTDGTFINFSRKDGLVGKEVTCIYPDASENVWIGTTNGLSCFNGNRFTNYSTLDGLSTNNINDITQDRQQHLWIATSNGLCRFNKNHTFKRYGQQQGLMDTDVKAILVDFKNTKWLATTTGLISFADSQFRKYSIKKDRNSNLIECLFQDYENNLWIGTGAGLFRYRGNPFASFGANEGLTSNFVISVLRDSKNVLWVGTQDGGLFKYKNNGFVAYNEQNGLPAKTVNAICEYTPGTLWLATEQGLTIYDGTNFTKKPDTTKVFSNSLNCFFRDSKNNLWMGGKDRLFKYDGKHFSEYTFKCRNDHFEIWTIIEDKQGTLWIGTYLGGLIKYNGKMFIECSDMFESKTDSYLASLMDKDGNLFFGSLDGLWMTNPSTPSIKPVHFSKTEGKMSSDLIYSLTFGKTQNELWVGTNQGLNRVNLAEYKKIGQKKITPFGKREGFSGVECNSGSFLDKDGSIWFATVNGLIKYDPKEYIENKSESKISLTDFRIFYNDTILTNGMHLRHSDNNITFNYSGICLTNPDKVLYSYILEGFQNHWSPPSEERSATFSNLPPGTYTFKVKSSNNEGFWNNLPATFTFTIDRPFWKNWWFIISSSLFFIVALVFTIRYRIRQIKTREIHKTELNKKIANIESQALRAQMNPHFIFNTLSSIQHYISNNDTDAALKYLSKFAKLMRRIMDNSKQQMIPVAEEINALNLYLELEVMRFANKFQYDIIVDDSIDQNYDRIPSMLIQPYVENSIIHGLLPKPGAGKISIKMKRQGDTILCIIQDNGIGREKSNEFKKNRVQQHKSMGMSITQERLDILNSSLNSNLNAEIIDIYEDGVAAGTKVSLVIPLEVDEQFQ